MQQSINLFLVLKNHCTGFLEKTFLIELLVEILLKIQLKFNWISNQMKFVQRMVSDKSFIVHILYAES